MLLLARGGASGGLLEFGPEPFELDLGGDARRLGLAQPSGELVSAGAEGVSLLLDRGNLCGGLGGATLRLLELGLQLSERRLGLGPSGHRCTGLLDQARDLLPRHFGFAQLGRERLGARGQLITLSLHLPNLCLGALAGGCLGGQLLGAGPTDLVEFADRLGSPVLDRRDLVACALELLGQLLQLGPGLLDRPLGLGARGFGASGLLAQGGQLFTGGFRLGQARQQLISAGGELRALLLEVANADFGLLARGRLAGPALVVGLAELVELSHRLAAPLLG